MNFKILEKDGEVRLVVHVSTVYNGMVNSGCSILACKWYIETLDILLMICLGKWPLVSAPACVHCCHIDFVLLQLQSACHGQHVQRSLGHVGVGMMETLSKP